MVRERRIEIELELDSTALNSILDKDSYLSIPRQGVTRRIKVSEEEVGRGSVRIRHRQGFRRLPAKRGAHQHKRNLRRIRKNLMRTAGESERRKAPSRDTKNLDEVANLCHGLPSQALLAILGAISANSSPSAATLLATACVRGVLNSGKVSRRTQRARWTLERRLPRHRDPTIDVFFR